MELKPSPQIAPPIYSQSVSPAAVQHELSQTSAAVGNVPVQTSVPLARPPVTGQPQPTYSHYPPPQPQPGPGYLQPSAWGPGYPQPGPRYAGPTSGAGPTMWPPALLVAHAPAPSAPAPQPVINVVTNQTSSSAATATATAVAIAGDAHPANCFLIMCSFGTFPYTTVLFNSRFCCYFQCFSDSFYKW